MSGMSAGTLTAVPSLETNVIIPPPESQRRSRRAYHNAAARRHQPNPTPEPAMRSRRVPLSLCLIACVGLLAAGQSTDRTGPPKPLGDFGVVGDGQADDTAAIQKAIDSRQGSIHFPKGVYRITRPVVIDLDKTGFTSVTADGTARLVMAGAG